MYPDLFGIHDLSYTLCMFLGIVLAFFLAIFYLRKKGTKKSGIIDLLICACFAVVGGIIFSILFENLYEAIALKDAYHWVFKMTFFGGLFGGVFGFLLTYYSMRKNVNFNIREVVKVAPSSILLAHGFGRVGCFLAGCCYGKPTNSWIGLPCSQDMPGINVIPVQLFEAIFLFILFGITFILLMKKDFKYNFVVYSIGYSIFRFIIEFFRDDNRGVAFSLSPSQIWSIVLFIGSIPLYFLLKKIYEKE